MQAIIPAQRSPLVQSGENAVVATKSLRQLSRETGVPESTIRYRRDHPEGKQKVAEISKLAEISDAIKILAETQANQSALLNTLLGISPENEIRLPEKSARAVKSEKPIAGGTLDLPESKEIRATGRRFFVTSAQNNSHVHEGLLASAKQWCLRNGGEIKVAKLAYNAKAYGNPKVITPDDDGLWYAPEIADYVVRSPLRLADDLIFCADLAISPTAVDPLSGLESYTKASSGIFAHTKHEMRSMASMKGTPARKLYTTGCITQANYVPLKTGKKAEHHHVYGGLVVEVDLDGKWFVRQINASHDGSFYDLNRLYTPTGSEPSRVEAITLGDVHIDKLTEDGIADAVWGMGGIVDVLKPNWQFIEDLNDFAPRNHHNIANPYFLAAQRAKGQESVEDEMQQCADILQLASRPFGKVVVVESNHDQAFARWLEHGDGHRDPPNARYWHTWNAWSFAAIERGEKPFPFEAAVREKAPDLSNVIFLREDQSFVICQDSGGIECSLHGHRGPNGSRGSTKGYRVLGVRTTTGHTHAAGIWGGQFSAGVTGDLDMGYNLGPSSWSHSHVLAYPNGKRAIITMNGPRWKGEPIAIEKPRIRVQAVTRSAA